MGGVVFRILGFSAGYARTHFFHINIFSNDVTFLLSKCRAQRIENGICMTNV